MASPLSYYNEIDPFAADWLEELIRRELLPDGVVDRRPIQVVSPSDLSPYTQCHFFAGIGGWAYALILSGIPSSLPIWTGSCPCQPFSNAGQGKGTDDSRHLWPYFHSLISKCRPPVVFGEQVTSPLGRTWLSTVRDDMEELGYGVGSADLCAAGIGAPHIRQRLYWVAESNEQGSQGRSEHRDGGDEWTTRERGMEASRVVLPYSPRSPARSERTEAMGQRYPSHTAGRDDRNTHSSLARFPCSPDVWLPTEFLTLSDGTIRPTQPGIFPLADGVPCRVGRLRGYGNAIVPQLAAEFICAYMETREDRR